jgi:hypothetical protein
MCLPEKSRDSDPVSSRAVRSLQSGFCANNREIRACWACFGGKCGEISLQLRLAGGEGGIRTLGTGVSPYNGLANESFPPPSLVAKHLQSGSMPPSRSRGLSYGSYCAPVCAPDLLS